MNKLDEKEWKAFALEDIFSIDAGRRLTNADKIEGDTPFIGATDNNNGVTGFVGNENSSLDKNALGVNYNGAPCIAFYHPYECIFTDDVKRLHLLQHADDESVLLFFKTVVMQQCRKYSYGYKFKEKRMLRQKLMLPVTDSGEPDYEYMAEYTRQKREEMLAKYRVYVEKRIAELGDLVKIPALNEKEWKEFRIGELFKVSRPKARNKDDYEMGDIPFVASGSINNGVMKLCEPLEDEQLDDGCCITVSPVDGSTFFQPMNFLGRGGAGSSILILHCEGLNLYRGQFMARAIQQTCSKYTYGHMGNKDSIKRERIMLPVADSGEPDYEYMEQYSKNMMLRKYRQYLTFLQQHSDA